MQSSLLAAQTNSSLFRAKMELCSGPLLGAFDRLWTHKQIDEMAIAFLILLHQIMRASVPLMECAVQRCKEISQTDRVASEVKKFYVHHIDEERDHDLWALEDFAAAGFDPDEVLSLTPSPEVAELAGAQYYWVHHHHPVMLLGYMAVLEAYPPTASQVDKFRDASGIPEVAFRTLRMHGELDPHHTTEIDYTFNSLPLEQYHVDMISLSILHTMSSLASSVLALRPVKLNKSAK